MAQFDVHLDATAASGRRYLLNVQSDLLADLATCVVVPLALAATRRRERLAVLMPEVDIAGERFVLMTQELAAIRRRELGTVVGNLTAQRAEVVGGLDLLFTGGVRGNPRVPTPPDA